MIDLEQKETIPEATLEIENSYPQGLYNQFCDWMSIKNIELTANPKQLPASNKQTSISGEILNYVNNIPASSDSGYDRCFGKASFDKGGGFAKGGYSKNC